MPKWLLFRPCHWVASGKSWRRPLQVLVKKTCFQELFPSTNPLTISFDDYWRLTPHWSLLNPYCWRVIPPRFPFKKSNAPGPLDLSSSRQTATKSHSLHLRLTVSVRKCTIFLEPSVSFWKHALTSITSIGYFNLVKLWWSHLKFPIL